MLLSASQHMPPVSAPSPTTATTCRSLAAQRERLGQPVGVGQGGGGVRVLDQVVLALGPARVAGEAAALAQQVEAVLPAGHDLVDVRLVAGVEQDPVARASRRPGAAPGSAPPRRGWGRGGRRCGRPSRPGSRGSPRRAARTAPNSSPAHPADRGPMATGRWPPRQRSCRPSLATDSEPGGSGDVPWPQAAGARPGPTPTPPPPAAAGRRGNPGRTGSPAQQVPVPLRWSTPSATTTGPAGRPG